MQHGDLEASVREELVVVLEGVLCQVTFGPVKRRILRTQPQATMHISWHDVPLKRLVSISQRWPDYDVAIVTFVSQRTADETAEYLTDLGVPYASIGYRPFATFVRSLTFLPHVRAVYDSDPQRLDHYGQLGHAVVPGEDW